jgi:hypothetical protein
MNDLTFYVIGSEPPEAQGKAALPGKETELHASLWRWFAPVAKEVPVEKLLESFDKTQRAIDAMLAKLQSEQKRGFRLEEFEVSLAVSGEGTIGIVTASAQAGVTLKFKRTTDN